MHRSDDTGIRRSRCLPAARLLAVAALLFASVVAAPDESAGRWPAYVLELPDSLSSVVIAETGAARIRRFDKTPTGVATGHDAYVSIGENGAGKLRAWDRKTPLGIYFVIDQLDTSRLHEKYGVMAFPLDYPNAFDRRLERTGDGIWIHGVERGGGKRPPLDTDGCLALPNEDLVALQASFVPNVTPVIVTPSIAWREDAERRTLAQAIRRVLVDWEQAQETGNVADLLALYAPGFEYRGLAFDDWARFRTAALEQQTTKSVEVDDLLLLADPVEKDLYLARFRHTVTTDDSTTTTTKRLYLKQLDDGTFKIIAEDNG